MHIHSPCPKSLDELIPQKEGFFCEECEHSVVDFRDFSKEKIESFWKEKTGTRVCGVLPSSNKPKINWKAVASIVVIFGTSLFGLSPLEAQNVEAELLSYTVVSTQQAIEIRGVITDKESGETLPFATVFIESLGVGAHSDFDGNYVLELPVNSKGKVEVVFSYVGYESQTVEVELNKETILLNCEFEYTAIGMIGEVIWIDNESLIQTTDVDRVNTQNLDDNEDF